jgi:hypothetical protein
MELDRLDGQVNENTKKESSSSFKEITPTSTQSAESSSTLSSKTHRSVKCGTDSISESESLHDEVKQAKDPCREMSWMERFCKDESFSPVQITDLDTIDQIQSSELVKETSSTTGENNNGCYPNGMGSNTIINIFYPDASGKYQKVGSMDAKDVTSFQQKTGTSGYPQSFGGFPPIICSNNRETIQILIDNTTACYNINRPDLSGDYSLKEQAYTSP